MACGSETKIVASQLSGDFILPDDRKQKLAFIAGGIGITPFRSMIKYLIDHKESSPAILFYSNRSARDVVYKDIFDQAEKELGIKTVYVVTDDKTLPDNWRGYTGRINETIITKEIPDYKERLFYLSGPRSMVVSYQALLLKLGVKRRKIKTDYFPGLV